MNFSIIIPFHNNEGEDRRSMMDTLLNSIPDRDDVEVIFVDDNSSLGWFPEIKFNYSKIFIISNETGLKYAGTARNTGLQKSSGNFVLFADSDDFFIKEKLSDVFDKVIENDNFDVYTFLSSSLLENGKTGNRHIDINRKILSLENDINNIGLCTLHVPFCKIIRRKFIEDNKLRFSNTKASNDSVFSVKLGLCFPKFKIFKEACYVVRQGNVSLTTRKSPEIVRDRLRIFREINELYKDSDFYYRQRPVLKAYFQHYHQSPSQIWKDAVLLPLRPKEFYFLLNSGVRLGFRKIKFW